MADLEYAKQLFPGWKKLQEQKGMRTGFWCNPCSDCTENEVYTLKRQLIQAFNLPEDVQEQLWCRKCTWREVTPSEHTEAVAMAQKMGFFDKMIVCSDEPGDA